MDPVFSRLAVTGELAGLAMCVLALLGLATAAWACGAAMAICFAAAFARDFSGLRPVYRDEGDGTRTRVGWR